MMQTRGQVHLLKPTALRQSFINHQTEDVRKCHVLKLLASTRTVGILRGQKVLMEILYRSDSRKFGDFGPEMDG